MKIDLVGDEQGCAVYLNGYKIGPERSDEKSAVLAAIEIWSNMPDVLKELNEFFDTQKEAWSLKSKIRAAVFSITLAKNSIALVVTDNLQMKRCKEKAMNELDKALNELNISI